MSQINQNIVFFSYGIIAISAVFGMFNSMSYLILSGQPRVGIMMVFALLEYVKGSLMGGLVLEFALILTSLLFAFLLKDKEFKLSKFIIDLNVNIWKTTKNALKIMTLQQPQFQ